MAKLIICILLAFLVTVWCKPLDTLELTGSDVITGQLHSIQKRFVNPSLASGGFRVRSFSKIRTKRSAEDCEKLELCKLHARSQRNFLAAFELYFVNKENARLWDHRAHTIADCYRRFSCYDR